MKNAKKNELLVLLPDNIPRAIEIVNKFRDKLNSVTIEHSDIPNKNEECLVCKVCKVCKVCNGLYYFIKYLIATDNNARYKQKMKYIYLIVFLIFIKDLYPQSKNTALKIWGWDELLPHIGKNRRDQESKFWSL